MLKSFGLMVGDVVPYMVALSARQIAFVVPRYLGDVGIVGGVTGVTHIGKCRYGDNQHHRYHKDHRRQTLRTEVEVLRYVSLTLQRRRFR